MTLDFPDPLGPTTAEKLLWKGPMICVPAYDLKSFSTILWMVRRVFGGSGAVGAEGRRMEKGVPATERPVRGVEGTRGVCGTLLDGVRDAGVGLCELIGGASVCEALFMLASPGAEGVADALGGVVCGLEDALASSGKAIEGVSGVLLDLMRCEELLTLREGGLDLVVSEPGRAELAEGFEAVAFFLPRGGVGVSSSSSDSTSASSLCSAPSFSSSSSLPSSSSSSLLSSFMTCRREVPARDARVVRPDVAGFTIVSSSSPSSVSSCDSIEATEARVRLLVVGAAAALAGARDLVDLSLL